MENISPMLLNVMSRLLIQVQVPLMSVTRIFIFRFLKTFIIENNIQSITYLGCGDCKCSKLNFDELHIEYTGYDCVYKNTIDKHLDYLVASQKFKCILMINYCFQTSHNTDIIENDNFHSLSSDYYPLLKYSAKKQ